MQLDAIQNGVFSVGGIVVSIAAFQNGVFTRESALSSSFCTLLLPSRNEKLILLFLTIFTSKGLNSVHTFSRIFRYSELTYR